MGGGEEGEMGNMLLRTDVDYLYQLIVARRFDRKFESCLDEESPDEKLFSFENVSLDVFQLVYNEVKVEIQAKELKHLS